MANFNIDATQQRTFQAIVIGSGLSGSWAAKELCEHGVKTLVIERGSRGKTFARLSHNQHAAFRI
jgi:choline dehydrogenase-like flavoprotein